MNDTIKKLSEEEIHKTTEAREKQLEQQMWSSEAKGWRARILGSGNVIKTLVGWGDRLLWSWFEEDVRHSQEWEKRQKQRREKSQQKPPNASSAAPAPSQHTPE